MGRKAYEMQTLDLLRAFLLPSLFPLTKLLIDKHSLRTVCSLSFPSFMNVLIVYFTPLAMSLGLWVYKKLRVRECATHMDGFGALVSLNNSPVPGTFSFNIDESERTWQNSPK